MTADVFDPRHDGYGFTGAGHAADNCRLVQGLFRPLDQLVQILAQDAEALDGFIVENPDTMAGDKL